MSKMNEVISYKGKNGYYGVMYGKSYLAVRDDTGLVRFHTDSREITTLKDLKEFVDNFEEFILKLG